MNSFFRNLCRTLRLPEPGSETDGQLLERFLASREENAFAALVERHGPMVLGVCRRIVGDAHAAEDAFQATFLVLVRKAGSIVPRDMVGNWLYGVACRTARNARALEAKRRAREQAMRDMPQTPRDVGNADLRPILDAELEQLPAKFRASIVLCDLEGKSRQEAARQLGLAEGTLSSRLARGREMLGRRLSRKGIALPAGAVAAALAENAAPAAVPAQLLSVTIQTGALVAAGQTVAAVAPVSVALLTEGVVKAMFLNKIKIAAALFLTLGLVGTGAGVLAHQVLTGGSRNVSEFVVNAGAIEPKEEKAPADNLLALEEEEDKDAIKGEKKQPGIQGSVVEVSKDGKRITLEVGAKIKGEAAQRLEIALSDGTAVTYFNVPPNGAKPTVGYSASVVLVEGSKDAAAEVRFMSKGEAKAPAIAGEVVAVSEDGRRITVEGAPEKAKVKGEKPEAKRVEYEISKKTTVTYFGVVKGGAKPTKGYTAAVSLGNDGKEVVAVRFQGSDKAVEKGGPKADRIGQLVSLDDSKRIALELPPKSKGDTAERVEFKISDKTAITYHGVGPNGTEAAAGMTAAVWLQEGSADSAARVQLLLQPTKDKMPDLAGQLKAVADEGEQLTLEVAPAVKGGAPRRTDVHLSPLTRVSYNGVGTGGAKPVEGYRVSVWLANGSKDVAAEVRFDAAGKDGIKKEEPSKGDKGKPAPDDKPKTPPEKGKPAPDDKPSTVPEKGKPAADDKPTTPPEKGKPASDDKPSTVPEKGKPASEDKPKTPPEKGKPASDDKPTTPPEKGKPASDDKPKTVPEKGKPAPDDKPSTVPEKGKPASDDKPKTPPEKSKPAPDDKPKTVPEKGKPAPDDKPAPDKAKPAPDDKTKPAPVDKSKPAPEEKLVPDDKQASETARPEEARPLRDPLPIAEAIDREIDKRLAAAKVPAAARADDAEFLRRACLDITGRIPTLERTRAFLDSTDADKRRMLIDELLASPAFGQHMGGSWRRLIVPRGIPGAKGQGDSFTPWLVEQFNGNRGWDQVVTELLTAEGDVRLNPATNFALANAENQQPQPNLQAASAARLFLGVQLQCAECHDHPFTTWKQTDFWATAAFFSRLRNGGNKGGALTLAETAEQAPLPSDKKPDGARTRIAPGGAIVIPASAGKGAGKIVKAKYLGGEELTLDEQAPLRPRFAAWATGKDNPYFARAFVNRTWGQFFGRGFVHPIDNFHEGNPSSHPELLNALAEEFKASGHDIKHLIRCVCNSQAYQRSSRPAGESDPEQFAYMAVKPLSPEALYDSLALVLGDVSAVAKPGTGKQAGFNSKDAGLGGRDQFINQFRDAGESAEPGELTHGIPQFLRRLNGAAFNRGAPLSQRLASGGVSREQALESLYLATLSRKPTAKEKQLMTEYLTKRNDAAQGYAGVLWILINSGEFVLNH